MRMGIQYTCHLCFIWQYQPCVIYIHLHTICLIGMTELGTATFHFAPNRRRFHWSISQWILLREKKSFRQKLKVELKFISAIFTFDKNMKSCIFPHSGIVSLIYLFVCMYISYKAHKRFTKETLLILSDVDVYMFPVLRSIPPCTTDMNLRSCILNRHKMRQSQIATIQESLPSHFVICRILWSWPWRHKQSPITLKTCSGYLGEYPCSLLTWIWKVSFLPILALFHCYISLCVCISVIKPIIDLQKKPYW